MKETNFCYGLTQRLDIDLGPFRLKSVSARVSSKTELFVSQSSITSGGGNANAVLSLVWFFEKKRKEKSSVT